MPFLCNVSFIMLWFPPCNPNNISQQHLLVILPFYSATSPSATLPFYSTTFLPSSSSFFNTMFPQQCLSLLCHHFMVENLSLQCCHFMMQHFPSISSSPHVIPCHSLPWNHAQSSAIQIVLVEWMHHKDKQFIRDLNMSNSIDHNFGAGLRGAKEMMVKMSLDLPKTLQCCHIVLADPQDWFIHRTFCKDSLHWWFLTFKFDLCLWWRVQIHSKVSLVHNSTKC